MDSMTTDRGNALHNGASNGNGTANLPNGIDGDDSSYLLGNDPEERKRAEERKRRECWRKFTNYLDPDYCCVRLVSKCKSKKSYRARVIRLGRPSKTERFPANVIRNQKYNVLSFVPLVLFEQFRYFFNFIFLLMAVSQFVPALRIGELYTYWAPLIFVIAVSMVREAIDDIRRWKRDRELNATEYLRLTPAKPTKHLRSPSRQASAVGATSNGDANSAAEWRVVKSADLQVGDIIQVSKNQRVPADLVLLQTTEKQGASFIRTDQLDGETDWKLRVAVGLTQKLDDADLLQLDATVYAEAPSKDVNNFIGTFTVSPESLPDGADSATYSARDGRVQFTGSGSTGAGGPTSSEPSAQNGSANKTKPSTPTAVTTSGSSEKSSAPSLSGMIEQSLSIENTMWASTVVASGDVLGLVIYTGTETRAVMNTAAPRNKAGLIDLEINNVAKLLFLVAVVLTTVIMILKGFTGIWYVQWWRFFLLFSYIIPLALRVNLDLAKIVYSVFVATDKQIPDTVPRTTTIPEELGRIQYLLTDKTGTLTRNEMIFKRLHIGTVSFAGNEGLHEVRNHLRQYFGQTKAPTGDVGAQAPSKLRRTMAARVAEALKAIAVCHNVTPVIESTSDENKGDEQTSGDGVKKSTAASPKPHEPDADSIQEAQDKTVELDGAATTSSETDVSDSERIVYQASSPDEVALVAWTEAAGLALSFRDLNSMRLRSPHGTTIDYEILQLFPFTSETKRMGIIVRHLPSNEITFYMKGADMVMSKIVKYTDWLEEECGNMAREGLRTLVVAKKTLDEDTYRDFEQRYHAAKMSIQDRARAVQSVIESLERDMELLCLTGVEDTLQEGVRQTLEVLRNAGVKIWMLTGDKLETAISIAKSSCLVTRSQSVYTFRPVTGRAEVHLELNSFRRRTDCALIITGDTFQQCVKLYEHEFMQLACAAPAVVVCRCSPTQKADTVKLIKTHTERRTCAIGDGGNDVSMIQAADCGVGIVGKEGKQASLAADFSVNQFSYLTRLLLVHGRNSYLRTAALGHFVIHRGVIITVMQIVFSAVFFFVSASLFPGVLLVGYATVFTMCPVFSLVLDHDVSDTVACKFPELYKETAKGREFSYKLFFMWVLISIYQGGVLMYGALLLFDEDFLHITAIGFTALILTELLMVAITVHTWHWLMIVAEIISIASYVIAIVIFPAYFDPRFVTSIGFVWRVAVITGISCIPLFILKYLRIKFKPPVYAKLRES